MNIAPNGSWLCETSEPHGFDFVLASAILSQLREWGVEYVKDFGCGSGAYVDFLNRHGIWAVGYDGNPNTQKFSDHCSVQDVSIPVDVGPVEAVISLEVGEHIPARFEQVFLDNLAKHAEKYLILSWFPYPGEGIGHVNEKTNDYIKAEMKKRGLESLDDVEKKLRESSVLWWFSVSVMVFKRI